jgi:hypothetical protein
MLTAYATQTDIPEALREHYSKREDGKWHADIPGDHPAVKHNAKLLSEKQSAEAKVTQLESDLESAKASSLPRGHVAVAKADAQLLEEVKAIGTPADITAKLAEHKTLKEESTKRAREDSLRLVAKELGYDNVDAFIRLPLPEFEIREKDGKKTVVAKVKEGDSIVEKPATEFIESSPDISPFLSALKTQPSGVRVPPTGPSSGVPANDVFAKAREFGKQFNEQAKEGMNIRERFGLSKAAS